MSTPNSSAAPYLTAPTLLNYYDARTIGDLCSDSGSRLSANQIATSAVVQQLLMSASGMVEAACGVAGRYQPTDLAGLTGASQAFLEQLVADLFLGLAVRRRPDKKIPTPPQFLDALTWLEMLRQGERIFGLAEAQNAGNVTVDQETAADVWERDLIVTQARRFFGRRVNQSRNFPLATE